MALILMAGDKLILLFPLVAPRVEPCELILKFSLAEDIAQENVRADEQFALQPRNISTKD